MPTTNINLVNQFLKLKSPTFNDGMNPVKANKWLIGMKKNFQLLKCDKVQKVDLSLCLLIGEEDH